MSDDDFGVSAFCTTFWIRTSVTTAEEEPLTSSLFLFIVLRSPAIDHIIATH
jgi:hypothetical protein